MDEAFGVKGPGGLQGTSALSQHIRCSVMKAMNLMRSIAVSLPPSNSFTQLSCASRTSIHGQRCLSFLRWRFSDFSIYRRLWAAGARDARLASAEDVANFLAGLDERQYWDLNSFPEVAELRALRFRDLRPDDQSATERRLRRGPPRKYWRRDAEAESVKTARRYVSALELRRIEVAGGSLPTRLRGWLLAWRRHALRSESGGDLWQRAWPIAVDATNTAHQAQDNDEIAEFFPLPGSEDRIADVDTLNTPSGKLVRAFLETFLSVDEIEHIFVDGHIGSEMLGRIMDAASHSGLIVRCLLMQRLSSLLQANPEWTEIFCLRCRVMMFSPSCFGVPWHHTNSPCTRSP